MGLTSIIAQYISGFHLDTIPLSIREKEKDMLLDYIAVTLVGAGSDAARIARKVLSASTEKNGATYLGDGSQHLPDNAARLNGIAAHALDLDDGSLLMKAHTGPVLFSTILALGEVAHISGKRLLESLAVGIEVGVRLSRIAGLGHYKKGWHTTSTIGTIGAAAAAAKVLDLDLDQIEKCLGISATQASGLQANFGTMVKPFHAGMAAANAVQASLLVQAGFTACRNVFENDYGFFSAFGKPDESANISSIFAVGSLELQRSGIMQKIHPSCGATHAAIDATLELTRKHDLQPNEIASIEVRVPEVAAHTPVYHRPQTSLEGKFSFEYCVAVGLIDKEVGLVQFDEDQFRRDEVHELIKRIKVIVDNSFQRPQDFPCRLVVNEVSGKQWTEETLLFKGHPDNPLDRDELIGKFRTCARRSPHDIAEKGDEIVKAVYRIDSMNDIGELMTLLK